jgi:hypothetical protein
MYRILLKDFRRRWEDNIKINLEDMDRIQSLGVGFSGGFF